MAGVPADDIGLTVHELHIMRALCIAVARAILGSCCIGPPTPSLPTICVHLHEAHGTIQVCRARRELPFLELEHLVVVLVVQHVDPRAIVGSVLGCGYKAQLDAILNRLDSIGALVLLLRVALHVTVQGACHRVGAQGLAPVTILVAVRVLAVVEPAPIRIEHYGLHVLRASSSITGPEGHPGICLMLRSSDLLLADAKAQRLQKTASMMRVSRWSLRKRTGLLGLKLLKRLEPKCLICRGRKNY